MSRPPQPPEAPLDWAPGLPRDSGVAGATSGGLDARGGVIEGARVAPEGIDTSHTVILYLEGVTVSFDGFKALNDLSLALDDGELRCVIGPNGAGKTTMMDVITGKTRPDSGKVFLGQTIDLTKHDEPSIATMGIGRKFQKPTVFEKHTVWENLELALKNDKRWWQSINSKLKSWQQDRIASVLSTIGLAGETRRLAGLLSHGQKQRLEIGMLLAQDPRVLLLDEPVAGMTDEETAELAGLLATLRGKHTIMVVEHDMDFIADISEKVTVLHEGHVLAEGTLDEVKANETVVEVYLGR
ncbi:MAG: urea ABC transporter ATP-binding protein UrtD [Proteobacteria bacterium]|nr:urea ABC transporter ATP-binding protein UrtD [Pseudomonadota bacterium]